MSTVSGILRKHAHPVPATPLARVRLRNFCLAKDRASSSLDGLLRKTRHPALMIYFGKVNKVTLWYTYKHIAHSFTISESYHMYAAGSWETKKGGLGLKPPAPLSFDLCRGRNKDGELRGCSCLPHLVADLQLIGACRKAL